MKQKLTTIISLVALTFIMAITSCAPISDSGNNSQITIRLPPIGSTAIRALNPEQVSRLQRETAKYRVTFNGAGQTITREGEGTTFSATFPTGAQVSVTVYCLNAKGEVIVKTVTKNITISSGTNNLSFKLSEDGTEIEVDKEDPPPNPNPEQNPGDTDKEPDDDEEPHPEPEKDKVKYSAGVATLGNVEGLPPDQEYEPGDTVTLPAQVTWDYGDFEGWKANVNLEVTTPNGTTTVPADDPIPTGSTFTMPANSGVVLTAQWAETEYNITYSPGNGQGQTNQSSFKAINPPDNRVALSSGSGFTKAGEVITGWLASGDEVGKPNDRVSTVELIQMMGGGTTLTLEAKWEAKQLYNVTFDEGSQSAAQGSMPQDTQTYEGGTISLAQKPTATGYDFKGWKVTRTDNSADITTLSESDAQYTMPGEYAITLTAQWQAKTLKVKYNANAPQDSTVTGSVDDTDRTYGQSFNLVQNGFAVQGYQFNGWFNAASGGQQVQGNSSTYMNDENDTTVFAQWTAIDINVTLNAGSGTGTDTQTVKFKLTDTSDQLPQTTTFSKTGAYTFAGWAYSDTGNTANTFDEIKTAIKSNTVTLTGTSKNELTLYAIWKGELASEPEVGDIIMKDGTLKKASDTNITAADTIAIVYKVENGTAWAVGKVLSDSGMSWATDDAGGRHIEITGLGATDNAADYTDGRTGLGILQQVANDAKTSLDNYPAWNYACNYGTNSATNTGIPTNMQSGWYLPSKPELQEVYDNKNKIELSLAKTGVTKQSFGTDFYWSSSQYTGSAGGAYGLNLDSGSWYPVNTKDAEQYVCAVRQFTY